MENRLTTDERKFLLNLARESMESAVTGKKKKWLILN